MFMKIFQKTSKIASKTQNCGKTRANWAKPLFIQVSVTPNRVESVKISQSPANFFHFVNQCNLIEKNYENFVHERQNHLKKRKLRENWT